MITIGIDESGTGAWAGSFTVCALAGYMRDGQYFSDLGVTDSKRLTDKRRRAMVADIVGYALAGRIDEVTCEEYNRLGKQGAWRLGMKRALTGVLDSLQLSGIELRLAIIIDGVEDPPLQRWIAGQQGSRSATFWTRFVPKADLTNPIVGAASILAKTYRNDLMIELHQTYPEYCFDRNAGYGTADHQRALSVHGKTRFHRDIKPIRSISARSK